MQHKSFGSMACPIARSLEHVGEWWSMLIPCATPFAA